uniref:Glutamate-rich WD repeat-containing protein 1 n=1 Tax=Panagrellus redivivus TaxID=6233 RepID=A0A7E4VM12_PANRE
MDHEDFRINSEDEMEVDDNEEVPEDKRKVYIPGVSRPLNEDEEWEFDPEAYHFFHTFETTKPCLSFDVILDEDGDNRSTYPLSLFLVGGSQNEEKRKNELYVMKLKNLYGFEHEKKGGEDDSDDDESSSESEDEDTQPIDGHGDTAAAGAGKKRKEKPKDAILHSATIDHSGNVNRIKEARLGVSSICAVWNDVGKVQLWNLTEAVRTVDQMDGGTQNHKMLKQVPLYTFDHKIEGYGLGWSPLTPGLLASGDQKNKIYIHNMGEGGAWKSNATPLTGHNDSVEDLQWSYTEANLLTSASVDKSIRLWDVRAKPKDACVCVVENAHDSDVNVISWNPNDPYIVSGGDDGVLKVWTLRSFQQKFPVATFKHHKAPITSVEWCPTESATFIASGEDDQATIWDLALETESGEAGETVADVPPQLLFVHMGQKEIKEVHWHRQIPGLAITTSLTGFNVFRTISV